MTKARRRDAATYPASDRANMLPRCRKHLSLAHNVCVSMRRANQRRDCGVQGFWPTSPWPVWNGNGILLTL